MIKPEMIPDEVVEAARRAHETHYGHELGAFTSAIAAALNAWPESHWVGDFGLHLPVPSEGGELESLGPEFEAAWDANVDRLYEFDKPEGEA